jgi:hypothetical protein
MTTKSPYPSEVDAFLAVSTISLKKLFQPIFTYLTKTKKCSIQIRGDYATISGKNGIVAAVYPYKTEIDLVLAMPYDKDDKQMFDAVDKNYKWRNLPAGVSIATPSSAKQALLRVKAAEKLVASGVTQEQDGEVFSRPKEAFQPAFKKSLRHR